MTWRVAGGVVAGMLGGPSRVRGKDSSLPCEVGHLGRLRSVHAAQMPRAGWAGRWRPQQFRLSMIGDERRPDTGHQDLAIVIHMDGQAPGR
jgi:hypothetical protein